MQRKNRLLLIGVILAVAATVMFDVLQVTANFLIAYAFTLIGIVALMAGALTLNRNRVQDIALVIAARSYLVLSLLFSFVVISLESFGAFRLPNLGFGVAHALLLAVFAIRAVSMAMGKEHIEAVEEKTAGEVLEIRTLMADVDAIVEKAKSLPEAEGGQVQKEIKSVYDAIRYSDPVSHADLGEYDEAIKNGVLKLKALVEAGDTASAAKICEQIRERVRERNNRVKAMK